MLALVLVSMVSGCASHSVRSESAPLEAYSQVSRVDAIAGRELVLPVRVRPGPNTLPEDSIGATIPVRVGRDTLLEGRVFRVRSTPASRSSLTPWVETRAWWEVRSGEDIAWSEIEPDGVSSGSVWVVVVDLPQDSHGERLMISGNEIRVRWHDARFAPRRDVGSIGRLADSSRIVRLLRPIVASPTDRWRVWLLNDRRLRGVAELAGMLDVSLGHEVLDLLDRQMIDRWRVALGMLGEEDTLLADDVRAALTRVVYLEGEPVPAWENDTLESTTLLESLLGAALPEQRISVAREWLLRQESIRVWIEDDFESAGGGLRRVRFAAANLRDDRARIEIVSGDDLGGQIHVLEPNGSGSILVAIGEDPAVKLVRDDARVPIEGLLEPISIAPPGGRIGPLLRPWTMATWLEGREESMPVDWMSAGLVYLDPDGDGVYMYLECRVPEDFFIGQGEEDVVRLWIGARGDSGAVLRVTSRGNVHDELSGADLSESSRVRRESDRWSAIVMVPRSLIDEDSGFLLGVERVHAGGGRSTWPRPVFPWESEPSRARFEVDGWHLP